MFQPALQSKSQSTKSEQAGDSVTRQTAIGNQALLRRLQAKLTVSQPGDQFEQEADRVSEQVMRMPAPAISRSSIPKINRKCEECEEETQVDRKETGDVSVSDVGAVGEPLRSPGQSLDASTREFLEPRFGYDFGHVRVHTDDKAAAAASSVRARAYTVGRDIVFGSGEYRPATGDGKRLLAHELTHVVQQSQNTQPGQESNRGLMPSVMREIGDDVLDKGASDDPSADQAPEELASGKKPKTADRIPTATTASATALKALEAAKTLSGQNDPAIWFDSWGNDLRDNDLSGAIDDKGEQGISDGTHYGKTFSAKVCSNPAESTDICSAADQSTIKVDYKVCIDVPIESYKAAGANVSTSRWIPTFFGELKTKPNWTVWKTPDKPSSLLDGDIVAASNPDHQHAGIVNTGTIYDDVINLPGPTSSRKFNLYNPSGKNDMKSVPRVLFEGFLSIDFVARINK